jgi:biotin synthase
METSKWDYEKINALFNESFTKLLFRAQSVHRTYFSHPDELELCSLLSIKTGACPEDCAYCPQSAHYQTSLTREKLYDLDRVIQKAKEAKEKGALRFCMGAAYRSPPAKDFTFILEMIAAVKKMGLETCVTLGALTAEHAQQLKTAGLDFYNHNIDTSKDYYEKIITTHTYQDRLDTLQHAANAGLQLCCGGILGMGETREDRIYFLLQLTQLPEPPKSIPINRLIPIPGTPLEKKGEIDSFEFVRSIAITRILMPASIIRLSAGRANMSDELQALCFMAGANSMWLGDKLLTTKNADPDKDMVLLKKLGISAKKQESLLKQESA